MEVMTFDDGLLHHSCFSSTEEPKVKEQNYINCTTCNIKSCAGFTGHWVLSQQFKQQSNNGHGT
jgi:hypothetical protein